MTKRVFRIAATTALALFSVNHVMAQDRIQISSEWGSVSGQLADNNASRALARMLPITIHTNRLNL